MLFTECLPLKKTLVLNNGCVSKQGQYAEHVLLGMGINQRQQNGFLQLTGEASAKHCKEYNIG